MLLVLVSNSFNFCTWLLSFEFDLSFVLFDLFMIRAAVSADGRLPRLILGVKGPKLPNVVVC